MSGPVLYYCSLVYRVYSIFNTQVILFVRCQDNKGTGPHNMSR